jgi:hypothetical protein
MLEPLMISKELGVALLLACALGASWPRFLTMFDARTSALGNEAVSLSVAATLALGAMGLALQTYGIYAGSALCLAGVAIGQAVRTANLGRTGSLIMACASLALFMSVTTSQVWR